MSPAAPAPVMQVSKRAYHLILKSTQRNLLQSDLYSSRIPVYGFCTSPKGRTIMFPPGEGYCDFWEAGNLFPPSIEHLQIFFFH